jgi:hypothetical protein
VAVGYFDLQRNFKGAQVLVHWAAQMAQAGVVQGREEVSKDQVDNSQRNWSEIFPP